MIEFEKFVFKQAVTYSTDKLIEIPLKDQGAIYIGGSNGGGKSLPFNVFFNILFGYTPLATKGKRKLIANENYYGRIDFKINEIPFAIEQYFNNSEFAARGLGKDGYNILKNGESLGIAGGIPECEKYIANLLPFTPDEFSGFYYLSQDALHVLAHGKGSERLNYLSKVFGFDIYDKIRAEIKLELDKADVLLADAVRAQEEVKKLKEKLSKYPDSAVLSQRILLYTEYLEKTKNEKSTLEKKKQEINHDINIIRNRRQLEQSLEAYRDVPPVKEIAGKLKDLRANQHIFERALQDLEIERKLREKYTAVEKFVSQDAEVLAADLDKLIQKKGQAAAMNLDVTRRETLKVDIIRRAKKLKYKPSQLTVFSNSNQAKLIESQSLLKKLNIELRSLSTLKGDAGKCSRCGHILNAEHIATEVKKFSQEIKTVSLVINECQDKVTEFNNQLAVLDKLQKDQLALKNITYAGTRIDILKLSTKIAKVRTILETTKEAQRLQKELQIFRKQTFSKKKYTVPIVVNQLKAIERELAILSKEHDHAVEKETIEAQLVKILAVSQTLTILQNTLRQVEARLSVIDEAVPLIFSDIKEAEIVETIVKDYSSQLDIQLKLMSQIEDLHTQRRILNACWKAYSPSRMKKEAVAKISTLIAQKLNIFVPLIFNEDISFVTDPGENSVDILFKRGNQPPRDVRFLNGGHKKRFLIALIPTLAGLVSIKKRTNLIILDEIDANVDQAGKEAIGEFLVPYLKEQFKTIIVISPSRFSGNQLVAPIPLDHFDKVLIATYKDGVSHLAPV